MRIFFICLLLLSGFVSAEITPAVSLPDKGGSRTPSTRALSTEFVSGPVVSDGYCDLEFEDMLYQSVDDYTYFKEKSPIQAWACLVEGIYRSGAYSSNEYDEFVVYYNSNERWKIIRDKKKRGHKNSLELYTISAKNAEGFAAINNEPMKKKELYFCITPTSSGYFSLCGWGEMIREENGREIDLTPYALKLIESIKYTKRKRSSEQEGQ